MASVSLTARLDRTDRNTSWGFRLYGGKDFGMPLTIQRVTPGSLAHKCGVQVGDAITHIGGKPTELFAHKDAQQVIVTAENSLELKLLRSGSGGGSAYGGHPQHSSTPPHRASPQPSYQQASSQPAYHQASQQPSYQQASPQPSYQQQPAPTAYPHSSPHSYGTPASYQPVDHNRAAAPFSPGGGGGVPIAVNNQYNTPLHLYSVDNAVDSLAKQAGLLNLGHHPHGGASSSDPVPPWRSPGAAPSAPSQGRPVAAPPSGGAWQPPVLTGPRNMRYGRPGDAKSMPAVTQTARIPVCNSCGIAIRGPFVLALDKSFCPDHFNCSNPSCLRPLIGVGFVEEAGQLLCETDYERYLAPRCGQCGNAIMRECVNALNNTFHPECFLCEHCNQAIGSGSFHVEGGKNYCDKDWQSMFQTKCYGCQFPIEPGDRWVEALNENWHSECFNCSTCQVNLEGQGFFAKKKKVPTATLR